MSSDASSGNHKQQSSSADKPKGKPSWPGRIVGALLFSLTVSILLEWVGIAFFWPEQGAQHSMDMMSYELQYLHSDFKKGLFESSPSMLITDAVTSANYYAFQWTMLEDLIIWIGAQLGLREYALATIYTTKVLLIRLGILTFSLPIYVIFAIVGASSGLSMRDIRRWSGGREYGRIYHKAKATAPKILVLAWIVYLAWPQSIHPNMIIFPCAILFGLNVLVVTASFKKYL